MKVTIGLLALLLTGGSSGDSGGASSVPDPGAVVRLELADAVTPNAPGQHLFLQEVIIPADTRLPAHYHEGVQIASVRAGTLTYHMLEGAVVVTRADGTTEHVSAPSVIELHAGDSVVEQADAVHFGENAHHEPVVITLAALIAADAGVSTPVD